MLKGHWEMVGVSIVLRKWKPIFDTSQAQVEKVLIWVRLPRIPTHLWNPRIFRMIGDTLGSFVNAKMSFKVTRDKPMARIPIILDLQEGLMGDICLNMAQGPFLQMLDYEEVPFRRH